MLIGKHLTMAVLPTNSIISWVGGKKALRELIYQYALG
ncbi:hypothetical protein DHBDCA_p1150 [Dehalobacter sp. DCA]|jgi:hypothetical protein|nr:hypothetical protein DHBDCA_p1150 [Dehalobacter sp. DCA]AFV05223.1 hypothetical protein DCF50_p1217 [Dehalobacter sp. CF]